MAAGAALVAGIAAPLVRRRLKLAPLVVTGTAALAPFALCVLVPRSRARNVGTCVLQMWAYVATYEMPNDDPDALERALQLRQPALEIEAEIDRHLLVARPAGVEQAADIRAALLADGLLVRQVQPAGTRPRQHRAEPGTFHRGHGLEQPRRAHPQAPLAVRRSGAS